MSQHTKLPLDQGIFMISLDTELAWGTFDKMGHMRYRTDLERVRGVITAILELFTRLDVSATWDCVGHLFLDHCQPINGIKHPQLVRPAQTPFGGDWFKYDPATDAKRAPAWYGKDIVEQILSVQPAQEIGCHTFSHVVITDGNCSRDCLASELLACQELADQMKIVLRSFVFPRNKEGYHDLLAKHGFTTYRGPAPLWYVSWPGPIRKMAYLLDHWLALPPPVVSPHWHEAGLWDLPASYYYVHRHGWGKLLPIGLRVVKATRGLERAARKRKIFHLWCHPFNIASDPDHLLRGLEAILRHFCTFREQHLLVNMTMGQLAEKLFQTRMER